MNKNVHTDNFELITTTKFHLDVLIITYILYIYFRNN